jgi:hypothetical protein
MAAAAIAARLPLLNARQSEAAVACKLAFDEPGGPLIAVCGLVGGSGASTLAPTMRPHPGREDCPSSTRRPPVLQWRDPDSNRGHHDFQTVARNTRTRAESPAIARVLRRDDGNEMSRKYRADVHLIRTRRGSRVLIDPLLESNNDGVADFLAIAFRRKRARLHSFAGRSLLVRRELLTPALGDARLREEESSARAGDVRRRA